MTQNPNYGEYWVGVDGGGTKCRAELFNELGESLGQGVGGPANIARHGQLALSSILTAVKQAVADAGLQFNDISSELVVSAGLAGSYLDSSNALLNQWQHPFAELVFSSDLHTALLGAHGGEDGVVMITGTGSCAAVLQNGKVSQYGGYGFQLGDQASGAWLGQMAARQALLVADKLGQDSLLWQEVSRFYNCSTSSGLVERLNSALPGEFARFAPRLFELAKHDPASAAIIEEGAEYLNELAKRALWDSSMNLVFSGGLAAAWRPYLTESVAARVKPALHGPEWGAVYLAQQQLTAVDSGV